MDGGRRIMSIGSRAKLVLGTLAVGALVGLAARAIGRRRAARRDRRGIRSVATFFVEPTPASEDSEWETLPGRGLFKQVCSGLALAGWNPSDAGDIEAHHECFFHLGDKVLSMTMRGVGDASHHWAVAVGPRLGGRRPATAAPADSPEVRRLLVDLDGVLKGLGGVRNVEWHHRDLFARGRLGFGISSPIS